MRTLIRTTSAVAALMLLAAPPVPDVAANEQAAPAAGQDLKAGQPGRAAPLPPRQGAPPRGGAPAGTWVDEAFNGRAAIGVRGTVDIATVRGDVTISGIDGNQVRVAAVKRVLEANKEYARTVLQNLRVRMTERGGGVDILTEVPEGRLPPIEVNYQIGVPYSASVTLRNFGGKIRVENVKGELRVEAFGGGDMTLSGVGRVRLAKSVGNLAIEGAEGDDVTAETSLGRLQVANVRARWVELRSISGAIAVSDTLCDRCTLTTASGAIDFSGPLKPDGRYSLNTQTGDIRLTPTGNVSFDLEAMTGGKLTSEFQLRSGRTPPPSPGAQRRILRGVVGAGSSIIWLRSFGGDVSILRKPDSK